MWWVPVLSLRLCRFVRLNQRALSVEVGVKVLPLVIDDDEGREILDFDLPHRFHTEIFEFQDFDVFDAVFGQPCGRAADGSQIEAPVLPAGLAHLLT